MIEPSRKSAPVSTDFCGVIQKDKWRYHVRQIFVCDYPNRYQTLTCTEKLCASRRNMADRYIY